MVHTFRNPDKYQRLPFREFLRNKKPHGTRGYVVEDLDLIIRVYSSHYQTDARGKFVLIELKFANAWLTTGQIRTFFQMDQLWRKADPERQRYIGFYVINHLTKTVQDMEVIDSERGFKINGSHTISEAELLEFLDLDTRVPGLFDSSNIPEVIPVPFTMEEAGYKCIIT
jgi:hypothetical protein